MIGRLLCRIGLHDPDPAYFCLNFAHPTGARQHVWCLRCNWHLVFEYLR